MPKMTSPDWVTLSGGPVMQGANGLTDAAGKPLGPNEVKRYVAANPNASAGATYLTSLEKQHEAINSLGVPNLGARIASHLPLVGNAAEGVLSASTQQMGPTGDAWIANAVQTMKALRMSPASAKFLRDTYVPQAGDAPATIAQKNTNREDFMARLRTASQSGAGTPESNPYMHD